MAYSSKYALVIVLLFLIHFEKAFGKSGGHGSETVSLNNVTEANHIANESHDSHEERYQIATLNFERVSTPLVVSLWLLLAVITKISM